MEGASAALAFPVFWIGRQGRESRGPAHGAPWQSGPSSCLPDSLNCGSPRQWLQMTPSWCWARMSGWQSQGCWPPHLFIPTPEGRSCPCSLSEPSTADGALACTPSLHSLQTPSGMASSPSQCSVLGHATAAAHRLTHQGPRATQQPRAHPPNVRPLLSQVLSTSGSL